MLPKLLTETLCSLKSNVDRLAFSVIWEMNSEGDILNVSYGKTVINSKASLTYKQASRSEVHPQIPVNQIELASLKIELKETIVRSSYSILYLS